MGPGMQIKVFQGHTPEGMSRFDCAEYWIACLGDAWEMPGILWDSERFSLFHGISFVSNFRLIWIAAKHVQ